MSSQLQLRAVTDADAAFSRALYASTRDDLRSLPLPAARLDDLIAMQQRVHEEGRRARFPDAEVLILECAGSPAGRVVVDTSSRPWRLVDLAILPAMRGRGLAGALLARLQCRAAESRAGIALSVVRTNTVAIRLYQRAGFSIGTGDELHQEMIWQPA